MSNCAMLYKYVKRTRYSLVRFYFYFIFLCFVGIFNKAIIPIAPVGFKMIIACSAPRASLAMYHLTSHVRSWNKR